VRLKYQKGLTFWGGPIRIFGGEAQNTTSPLFPLTCRTVRVQGRHFSIEIVLQIFWEGQNFPPPGNSCNNSEMDGPYFRLLLGMQNEFEKILHFTTTKLEPCDPANNLLPLLIYGGSQQPTLFVLILPSNIAAYVTVPVYTYT